MADVCDFDLEPDGGPLDRSSHLRDVIPLTDSWDCPHDPYDSENKCIFHIDNDRKAELDIGSDDIQEELRAALERQTPEYTKFIGAELPVLPLRFWLEKVKNPYPLDFRYSNIGVIMAQRSVIPNELYFHHSNIGGINARRAEFERDVEFVNTTIGKNDFIEATFQKGASFDDGTFTETAQFRGSTFELTARYVDTEFHDDAWFPFIEAKDNFNIGKADISGIASFQGAEIEWGNFSGVYFNKGVTFSRMVIGDVSFNNTNFGKGVTFADGTIKEGFFRPSFGNSEIINLAGVEFSSGNLILPTTASIDNEVFRRENAIHGYPVQTTRRTVELDWGEQYYDFSEATIGDINIEQDSPEDLANQLRFNKTDFSNFDFTDYRRSLKEADWRLHEFGGDTEFDIGELDPSDIEISYSKARKGANEVGDDQAASEFIIREKRFRRKTWAKEVMDAGLGFLRRSRSAIRWGANLSLDLSSAYGEKPHRIVIISFLVVVLAALIYPIDSLGSVSNGSRALSYVSLTEGPLLEVAKTTLGVLFDSLYFSITTFTTLGYGDFQPHGYARIVTSIEALSGVFLMALLIYSLGKQIAR